ncbi:MAG TPA: flagellar assembly protein FliW [Azoarcus sp.]|nr:flagellar assembly protein FliW [Azoarcus sp.]
MKIESPLLGSVEVADDKLLEFPAGLAGFEELRRFALLHDEEGTTEGLYYLLSIDRPEVLFTATEPSNLSVNYEFALSEAESAMLDLGDLAQAALLVILRREDAEELPDSAGLRANFMAPLVINMDVRRGLQKVLSRVDCAVTLRAA